MLVSEEVREFLMTAVEEEFELAKLRRVSTRYYNELVNVYNFLDNNKQVKLKRVKRVKK